MKPFRKDKSKLVSAAHIKRNTEGTSNEISFSVLDAAKMELEGKIKNPSQGSHPGRIALFTLGKARKSHETPTRTEELPLSSDTMRAVRLRQERATALSSEYEVARRKGKRKLRRVGAAVAVLAITAVIVTGAGMTLMSVYQANQGSVSSLQDALDRVSNVDEVLVRLNDVVEDPLNPDHADDLDAFETELPKARQELADSYGIVETAFESIVNPHDREAAGNALSSIDARISMIDAGSEIANKSAVALDARSNAVSAWNSILEADALAREAAALANEGTSESIESSKDRSNQAIASLNDAAYLLALAQDSYPAADLSAYEDYVAKRIEAFNHAIASDDAFLAEDSEAALAENDAYNTADSEAATMAHAFPESIEIVIEDALREELESETASYEDARARAASTDAFIRAYRDTE